MLGGDSGLNYDRVRRGPAVRDTSVWAPNPARKGLHAKCEGCPHIINKSDCRFVQTPKSKRFPCYFKEYVEPKEPACATAVT